MDEAHDIIIGLDAGADDYLPKPYNTGILGARINVGRRMIEMQEQEALHQLQLNQAQKMESVGRLAGGVAHDFNNKLAVIIGYVELILLKMAADSPFIDNLKEIRKAAESSADLTRQLLAFARKQAVTPKVLELNETVAGMLNMLRRLIGEDIDLSWQPGTDLLQIKMDPSQIDQILANLCVNARDAINGVGRITIGTEAATFDSEYCDLNAEFIPGDYVLLVVSDTGCGMDTETQTNIFEPFFTTKKVGQGTGLGLASVYGAVKQNNGFIKVYSELGHGTTFRIYLPRYQGKDGDIHREDRLQSIVRGSETILLVEDDAAILAVTTMLLEDFGYRVLAANTPGEAIQLAREHSGEINLLMTDVIMPEMNGRDLARNMLAIYPGMKRLFMSGYTADIIASQGMLDAGVNFIQKPFAMQTLAVKVREVLDK
ncbi:MAG: response regulator [Geobacteraceae bacterium]|nr:response regulator [Geobacteraceae bacterium]NTW80480.1 response regulator [Geobacteraceae bacterium]